MSQQDNIFSIKLVKKDGFLVPADTGELAIYKEFVGSIEEGQIIESFYEVYKDDGTNLQLAKIHVCIRKLATEIGYPFEEMKKLVKEHAGLVYGGRVKSLADCSKEELGLVIEAINEIGKIVNISF
jgi:hypothetical protein